MDNKVISFIRKLFQSYLFVVTVALLFGLFFSKQAILFAPFSVIFLQIIFFLTSLKMDIKDVIKEIKYIKAVLLASLFMLIILPITIYYLALWLVPSMAVALLLLSVMPTAMIASVLADVAGGRPELALILTITTSLLAPFTIPFVIGLVASTAVTVQGPELFWSLVQVIFIPFALAQVIKIFTPKKFEEKYFEFKTSFFILLALIISGVVAKQSDFILANLNLDLLYKMLILFAFMVVILLIGYFIAFWRKHKTKLTISLSVTFFNFTLAIYLADSFFKDSNVLLIVVLSIFPWALLLIPYKKIMGIVSRKTT